MDIYEQIVAKIIQSQEAIIGPVALEQAEQVPGLKINWETHKVSITGKGPKTVDGLVEQYKELFGQISVEVSKEAVANLVSQLPAAESPQTLI